MPCKPACVICLSDKLCRCTLFALDIELESCSFSYLFLCLWRPRHCSKALGTFTLIKRTNFNNYNTTLPALAAEREYLVHSSFSKNLHVPLKADSCMLQLPIILCRYLHFIFKHSMQMFVKILCQHKSTDKSEYIFCKCWRSGKSTAAVSLGLVLLQRASGDAPTGITVPGQFPIDLVGNCVNATVNNSLLTLLEDLTSLIFPNKKRGWLRREDIISASDSLARISPWKRRTRNPKAEWRNHAQIERPQLTILWEMAEREGRGLWDFFLWRLFPPS